VIAHTRLLNSEITDLKSRTSNPGVRFLIRRLALIPAAALAMTAAPAAFAGGLDALLYPNLDTGRIQTGAFNDDTKSIVSLNQRVFLADFGEADPLQPNFADDPGFRGVPASADPALQGDLAGQQIAFNFLDAVRRWDGSDFDAVSPHTMSATFGPLGPATTSTTPGGFVGGFALPAVPSSGEFDDHLNFFLDGPDDSSSNGIFLLTLELFTESDAGAGFGASRPVFFVFNKGLSEAEHDLAADFVRTNIIPAPSGAAGLLLAGAACASRRRRR